jgi:hypothetical protein
MSEIDYTRAIRAAQRRNQGVVAGILACIFAVLGIFTLGILFVPIAAFCGAVGLLRGAIAFNISGLAVSALGIFLSVVGVATSPSLLLALGLVLASNSKQPKIGDSAPQISCGSGVCFPMRPDNPADQALAASANERRAREAAWSQATSTPVPITANKNVLDVGGINTSTAALRRNQIVSWRSEDGDPKIFSNNDLTITLSSRRDPDDKDSLQPVLHIKAATGQAYDAFGQSNVSAYASFGVGKLDPDNETDQVIFINDSAGNHCCAEISVLELVGEHWKELTIGSFAELASPTDFPIDTDDDGTPDIVAVDDRFLGAFESFGVVFLPPKIFNLRSGLVLDVSKKAKFNKLYRADMEKVRQGCLAHSNAACAAFVADASRVGLYDWAWQIMLSNYNVRSDWDLPSRCLATTVNGECPEGKDQKFANFPDALAWFLSDAGYERVRKTSKGL